MIDALSCSYNVHIVTYIYSAYAPVGRLSYSLSSKQSEQLSLSGVPEVWIIGSNQLLCHGQFFSVSIAGFFALPKLELLFFSVLLPLQQRQSI